MSKNPPANDLWVRKIPLRTCNPLQHYRLEIPWTEDPTGGYSPWSHKRVGYDLATKQLTAKQLANISKLRIITSRPS